MKINIIGVDCATVPKKVGLAFASMGDCKIKLIKVYVCSQMKSLEEVAESIAKRIDKGIPTLLAIDAPLGWPDNMGELLAGHSAGQPIRKSANKMFRRQTDCFIKKKIRKQPLDVGADRIARTAYAALYLLKELRKITKQKIPLAWSRKLKEKLSAIEVYPAATLKAYSIEDLRYKKPNQEKVRESIISKLKIHIDLQVDLQEHTLLNQNADALDAVVCTLAANDFLLDNSMKPADNNLAKKEGWIWVKNPN